MRLSYRGNMIKTPVMTKRSQVNGTIKVRSPLLTPVEREETTILDWNMCDENVLPYEPSNLWNILETIPIQ